jgi:Tol biopolymer transport system component
VKTYEVGPTVQVSWDALVRWSADGRSLTYVNNHAGVENVWGQPIDSGTAKQLTNFTDSRILSFDWTREGSLVASRGVVTSDVVLITDVP